MLNQQHDPSGLEGTKRSRKGLFVAGGCAVAAVLAATAFFGYQGYRHNQLVNTYTPVITDALVAQFDGKDAIDGLAANDYVNPSPYHVSDVSLASISEDGEKISADVNATIANDSFSSEVTARFSATRTGDEGHGDAEVSLVDVVTTPLSGISGDPEHGVSAEDVTDYEAGDTYCRATVVENTSGSWLLSSGTTTSYRYEFDGDAWRFDGADRGEETTEYGDLEGTYVADGISLTISDLDKKTGDCVASLTTQTSFEAGGRRCESFTAGDTWSMTMEDATIEQLDHGYYGFDGNFYCPSEQIELADPGDVPDNVVVTSASFYSQILFHPDDPDKITLTLQPSIGEPAVGFTQWSYPGYLYFDVDGTGYYSYSSSGGVAELEDGNITLTRTS